MAAPANPGSSPDEPHRDPSSPAGRWVPSRIDDGLYRHLEPGELRSELMRARLLAVYGVWQRDDETGGQVRHLVAKRLKDLTPWLGELDTHSRDFH